MLQLLLFLIFSISVLIKCRANQLNGFYLKTTLVVNGLSIIGERLKLTKNNGYNGAFNFKPYTYISFAKICGIH